MTLNRTLPLVLLASVGVLWGGCNMDFPSPGTTDGPPDNTDGNPPPPDDVPSNAYCDPVAAWDEAWAAFEEEVVTLMNVERAQGADCGSAGVFEPATALTMDPALRCAARKHSLDMSTRDFFGHTDPDGDGPGDRIEAAGYVPLLWGENIASGYSSPQAVVDGWMGSDGHCANIMNANFTDVGVGYYEGNLWTAAFGDD